MEGHGEAAADVITGGVIARAVEPAAGESHKEGHGNCLNCGAALIGNYCSNCGQPAHLHRTLSSLGHDILHGVFHFEGKVWRTLPELFFHPGRLTRRYIDGERVKFVSPMALYLFAVFLMFAVFSFTGGAALDLPDGIDVAGVGEQWKENVRDDIDDLNNKIEAQREKLAEAPMTPAQREHGEKNLAGLISAREAGAPKETQNRFGEAIGHIAANPALLSYKLKTAGYKYSWALVPLSVPFLWLLFFWRRDIHLYDHAIFITYSISFMMLFVMVLSLASALGVSAAIWGWALAIIPPLHLYKQLRGAYGLSRFGTWVRLFLLGIIVCFVLVLFSVLLLALGMSG